MTTLESRRAAAVDAWAEFQGSDRPQVFVGASSCGRAAGAMDSWVEIERALGDLGVDATVHEVGCIGPCYLEPLVDVRLPGTSRISWGNITPKRVGGLLKNLFVRETIPQRNLLGHLDDRGPVDDVPRFFNHPMLARQVRLVLRNCGIIDPSSIEHYLARDGYQALATALSGSPEDAIEVVKASGLRGRGGGGFPTWLKWNLCRDEKASRKVVICNADEGDPGAFMDRSLIEGDPHAVLEGLAIAAYGIGAHEALIYIRAEYPLAIARLRTAIAQMYELGALGDDVLGSGWSLDIKIKQGAGAFVCGEETALMASIEGRRGMPRVRPPYPSQSGLWGVPTIINNVETLANLPNIFRNGPEWYAGYGTEDSRGTKTFSLTGKVRRTGLIEVPMGTTLREVVFDIGGGMLKPFKAVQTGGPSGGCLNEEYLDEPIDYATLARAGSIMGSGGLIVLDSDTCMVDLARYFLEFTQAESCGKCVPCRVGTRHLVEILERICAGHGEARDLSRLEKLGDVVGKASLCGLGSTAPNPVISTLRFFRHEYLDHVSRHTCSAAICKDLVVFRIIPDKCTGCQVCVRSCPVEAITGPRSEPHVIDEAKCIKCRACYEVCKFDAVVGDSVDLTS